MANALARVLFTASDPFNVSDMCPATGLATACVQMKRTNDKARNAQRLQSDSVIKAINRIAHEAQQLEESDSEIKDVFNIDDYVINAPNRVTAHAAQRLEELEDMNIDEVQRLEDLETYNLAGKLVSTKETKFKKDCYSVDIDTRELNIKEWKKVNQVLPENCGNYLKEWAEAEADFAAVWLKNPKLPFFHKNMILVDYFTKTIESLRKTTEEQKKYFESVRSELEKIEAPNTNAEHVKMEDYRQKVMALLLHHAQLSSNPFVQGHLQLQRSIHSDGSNNDSPFIAVILGPSASGKTHFAANGLIKILPSPINDVSKAFVSIVDGGVVREAMQSWQYGKAMPHELGFEGFSDLFKICHHAINVVKKNLANFMIDQKLSFFLPDTATNWGTGMKLVDNAAQRLFDDLLVDVFSKVESHTIVFSAVISTKDVCKIQGTSREKTEGKKYNADSYGRGITAISVVPQYARDKYLKNKHRLFHNQFYLYFPDARVDKNEAVVEYVTNGKIVKIDVKNHYDQIEKYIKQELQCIKTHE